MHSLGSTGLLLGRLLIGCLFFLSGVGKLMDPAGTAAYMAMKGMTMIPFFLYAAALIEILGGLSIILGFRPRWGAGLLFVYLIPVTAIFHAFWGVSGPAHQMEMINFFKNLAIFGGLLYIIVVGAGSFALDACCKKG